MAVCVGKLIHVVISLAEKHFRQGKDWKIFSLPSDDRVDPTSKCLDQSSRCLQDQASSSFSCRRSYRDCSILDMKYDKAQGITLFLR